MLRVSLGKREPVRGGSKRGDKDMFMCVFWPSYPPRHSGVSPLFELWVSGKADPHYVRCVILVPQLWTALKKEVYDEELDAGIQAWRETNRHQRLSIKSCTAMLLSTKLFSHFRVLK